jgi:hypothetical protein
VVVTDYERLCARSISGEEDLARCTQISCPMRSRVFGGYVHVDD